jgi:hypothetical protein
LELNHQLPWLIYLHCSSFAEMNAYRSIILFGAKSSVAIVTLSEQLILHEDICLESIRLDVSISLTP